MIARAEWIERARETRAFDFAIALGLREIGRTPSGWCVGPCPACGAEHRHTRSRDRRAAVGIAKSQPRGWKCWQCDASGDSIDLAAYVLRGSRYRDLADAGRADVREWICSWLRIDIGTQRGNGAAARGPRAATDRAVPPPPPPASVEPEPTYPPLDEVRALWRCYTVRVDEDPAVAAYLRGCRKLDPTAIADADIARALRPDAPLPHWARARGASWTRSGHRILTLLFDKHGWARSVIARSIDLSAAIKSAAPRGYTRTGLVMADALGKWMLRHGTHPSVWPIEAMNDIPFTQPAEWWPAEVPLTVVVAEGEIDLLTWATEWSDGAEHPPATLGVVQGSWSAEIAARIPDGSTVLLAQHRDTAGHKYAEKAIASLKGRALDVRRWTPGAAA